MQVGRLLRGCCSIGIILIGSFLGANEGGAQSVSSSGWRTSLSLAYSPSSYADDTDGTVFPSLSIGKGIEPSWVLRMSGAWIDYEYGPEERAKFFPVAAGIRLYVGKQAPRRLGLFVDVAPLLAWSQWTDAYGNAVTRVLPGVTESIGFGVPLTTRLRSELSITYMLTRGTKVTYLDSPPAIYEGLSQASAGIALEMLLGR